MAYIGQAPALAITQTADIADNAITSSKIAQGTVVAADIADDSVTVAKIAPNAIIESKIADNAVTTSKITASAITETRLAVDAVTTNKIANSSITTDKIASGSVTNDKLPNSVITTEKIASGVSLTSPVLTAAFVRDSTIERALERANVTSSAVPATLTYNLLDQTLMYFTGNSTANVTINFTGNATTTLDNVLNNSSNTVTAVLIMTNGATPYYVNNVLIDGKIVHNATIKGNLFWQGNSLTIGGTSNSIESYGFTFIKKASNTYSVLGSQTSFVSVLV